MSAAAADFEALVCRFRARGFFVKRPARVLGELAVHVALMLGGAAGAVLLEPLALRVLAVLVSTWGGIGVVASAHTASHHGVSDRVWLDEGLARFGFTFCFQIAATSWRHRHVETHHPHANVLGLDCDADLAPWFLLSREQLERSPRGARWYYRLQWLWFPPALAFNMPSAQLTAWRFLLAALVRRGRRRREHWLDLAALVLHWVAWLLVPLAFLAPADVVGLYLVRMALMGYGMFAVAAPAHFPAEAAYLAPEAAAADRLLQQTAATLNFRTGWLGALLVSGSDHQIEHHLFPDVCHLHYRAMRADVEAFCRSHGYPYRRLAWPAAIWGAYRTLARPKPVVRDPAALRRLAYADPGAAASSSANASRNAPASTAASGT